MLIRTQCKEQLINFNHISSFEIVERMSGETGINAMYPFGGINFGGQAGICIGIYSTKERALQVLDKIQSAYRDYKYVFLLEPQIAPAISDPIFEMPEDTPCSN